MFYPADDDEIELPQIYAGDVFKTLSTIFESIIRSTFDDGSEATFLVNGSRVPFLKQACFIISVWLVMCSLVMAPSYRGALLSFFYSPFQLPPINTLNDLHKAMAVDNFTLGVTFGSSSYGIISTGDGIYSKLWDIMERKGNWKINSVSAGMERVKVDHNFGVLAGREKLIYEKIHKGQEWYHINTEVFFTKYKGVALRNGSPMRSNIDWTLTRLYDFGLINKITLDEYNCLTPRKGKYANWMTEKCWIQEKSPSNERALTFAQLQALLTLLLILLGIALVVFICEIWNAKRKLAKLTVKATKVEVIQIQPYQYSSNWVYTN